MSCHDPRLLKPATNTRPQALNQEHYRSGTQRWHAVQGRDPDANNAFYYGAVTTSIYCRPTCPGRVARRSNIVFFDTTSIAVQHGYRPCKRCSPDLEAWDRDARGRELVRQAEGLIQDLCIRQENWTVEEVAKQLGIGAAHLHRLFKKHLGRTPKSSGHQRDISLGEIHHQHHITNAVSTGHGTTCSPESSTGVIPAVLLEQNFDDFPSKNFDFDFSRDPYYLPGSNSTDSFDLCTTIPATESIDLPSVDEYWTEWLSM